MCKSPSTERAISAHYAETSLLSLALDKTIGDFSESRPATHICGRFSGISPSASKLSLVLDSELPALEETELEEDDRFLCLCFFFFFFDLLTLAFFFTFLLFFSFSFFCFLSLCPFLLASLINFTEWCFGGSTGLTGSAPREANRGAMMLSYILLSVSLGSAPTSAVTSVAPVAARAGSSSALLSCIDNALRSLDEVVSDSLEGGSAVDPKTAVWLCRSIRSCVWTRQRSVLERWCLCVAAERTRETQMGALAVARALRMCVKHRSLAALSWWRCVALWEASHEECRATALAAAEADADERQSIADQLAATEAEKRWLRRTLHSSRLLHRSLVMAAVLAHNVKFDAFQTLKRNAVRAVVPQLPVARSQTPVEVSDCIALRAARHRWSSTDRRSTRYTASSHGDGAQMFVFTLAHVQRRLCDFAWRRLLDHVDLLSGQALAVEASSSAAKRMQLRSAMHELNREMPRGLRTNGWDEWMSGLTDACGPAFPRAKASPLDLFAPGRTSAW